MYNIVDMDIKVNSVKEMTIFGKRLGSIVSGGEVIQLVGDLGAGKTTLVKAIARGMGVTDDVGSPSYTLSQIYDVPGGRRLAHYDFYRLDDSGILADELKEDLSDGQTITVIEWGAVVADVLPRDHLQIRILPINENARQLSITAGGDRTSMIVEQLT